MAPQTEPQRLESAMVGGPPAGTAMGLTHCPLCLALALVSTLRGAALALLVWRGRRVPLPV